MDLNHKRITIIGAGRSGSALIRMIIRLGGIPKLSDIKEESCIDDSLKELLSKNKVVFEFGGHSRSFIEDSDLLVLSPGVRFDAKPVLWASQKQIPVLGEIELASQYCDIPIIAVTGSNGKTTVVNLITKVLESAGKKVCLCGNVGMPFAQYVLDLKGFDYVVLEVSSFQLETIEKFRPYIAVLLNFSQNHLDRHRDMQEYFEAKTRIFENQTKDDFAVLNYDDNRIKDLAQSLNGEKVFFNSSEKKKVCDVSNPNHLAVMAVSDICGIKRDDCCKVFSEFKGVEHRLEKVLTLNEIEFINDSKATTAESGRWALESINKPIIMICGGRDKNIDFYPLRELVKSKVKKMVLIGESKKKFEETFSDVVVIEECESLQDAVLFSRENAVSGDCVLFSPMCASFDMFSNFEERGTVFKDIVRGLAKSLESSFS